MGIRNIVLVGSGKGGVGKTSVTLGLAYALRDSGARVGVLDADLYGPDVPAMLGLTRTRPATSVTLAGAPEAKLAEPVVVGGVAVASAQFLIGERQSLSAAGPLLNLLFRQLWTGVAWGDLDYLLVDFPPGTGDVQQAALELMPVSGAIVVVTPQSVAHLDTHKLLEFFERSGTRVLGGIENMSEIACPHCEKSFPLFGRAAESRTIWGAGVTKLGALPFESPRRLPPPVDEPPATPGGWILEGVAAKVRRLLP